MQGYVAPGYEIVRDAFAQNFEKHSEVGASFAAVRNGELVVDVWGGLADRQAGRLWSSDSLQLIFSGTKGLVATCILILMERGQLALDLPVCTYWPEFGKPSVTIRDVMGHTARLPGIKASVGLDDVVDDRRMAALLAVEQQSDDPRSAFAYHAFTYGWLCGELVRRVDGRSVGSFFHEEVAQPLGLELWIGLPRELEDRVTKLELGARWGEGGRLNPSTFEIDALTRSIWANPELISQRCFPWNRWEFHAAEIPGVNAIGTARSIARLYSCLASGGEGLLTKDTLELARIPFSGGIDPATEGDFSFGVGFQLQTASRPYGPPDDAFGHNGAGGSSHGGWPSLGMGYSYAMNLLCDDVPQPDPRAAALINTLFEAATR